MWKWKYTPVLYLTWDKKGRTLKHYLQYSTSLSKILLCGKYLIKHNKKIETGRKDKLSHNHLLICISITIKSAYNMQHIEIMADVTLHQYSSPCITHLHSSYYTTQIHFTCTPYHHDTNYPLYTHQSKPSHEALTYHMHTKSIEYKPNSLHHPSKVWICKIITIHEPKWRQMRSTNTYIK